VPAAVAVAGIAAKGMRVGFYSTIDLVNQLVEEKAHLRQGGSNCGMVIAGGSGDSGRVGVLAV
jgi:hypothetical protein